MECKVYALVLFFLMIPSDGQPHVTVVDEITVNHFYDEHGKKVFSQVIFWEWENPETNLYVERAGFCVRHWKLFKDDVEIYYNNKYKYYVAKWIDPSRKDPVRVIEVHAKKFHENWTQYDPELENRSLCPQDKRKTINGITTN